MAPFEQQVEHTMAGNTFWSNLTQHAIPTNEHRVAHNMRQERIDAVVSSAISVRLFATHALPKTRRAKMTPDQLRRYFHKAGIYHPELDKANVKPFIDIHHGSRVALTEKLSKVHGLSRGSLGTVVGVLFDIYRMPQTASAAAKLSYDQLSYFEQAKSGIPPPYVVLVAFDDYEGKEYSIVADGIVRHFGHKVVPVAPNRHVLASYPGGYLYRDAVPLELSHAVTVHKLQGETLASLYFTKPDRPFARGLVYVACSRVTDMTGLVLTRPLCIADVRWGSYDALYREDDRLDALQSAATEQDLTDLQTVMSSVTV